MDTKTFGALPYEIQEAVIPFLRQQDLAICTRVCRAWNAIFHPALWRHVEDRSEAAAEQSEEQTIWMEKFIKCARAGALKNNGHLIQSLRLVADKIRFCRFLAYCPPTFPQLTSVWIDGVHNGEEDDLADFLDLCTAGLKEVVYGLRDDKWQAFQFGFTAAEALTKHAATLEVFRLEGDYRSDGDPIDHLLCSLPNLKELSFVGNCVHDRGGFMNAREIVSSEWVCTNLEVFGCGINSIFRPELEEEIANESKSAKEESRQRSIDLQRQIYSQLARFTKLRKLSLGFPAEELMYFSKEQYRQRDGLAMTLESGLDLLKGLKDLQEVELYYMDVGIGNPAEEAWVAENWPKAHIGRIIYES
ncbi:hypothetical protein BGZ97_005895 [Linnemannia gamsii]|jgi:hypothetical protein|uniref:F-box domain-containing protein n=1 Tax=Linnemannia gamsii TaxID=64522 RepID=A0A9P6USB4_9FUNG|nr:hypothetical protein BGZ97_005895 [Linnemannia gamsii]